MVTIESLRQSVKDFREAQQKQAIQKRQERVQACAQRLYDCFVDEAPRLASQGATEFTQWIDSSEWDEYLLDIVWNLIGLDFEMHTACTDDGDRIQITIDWSE